MGTRTYNVVFNGAGTAELPAGRFFFVKSAAAALTIETAGNPGAPVRFENVGAGLKFKAGPEQRWKQLRVTSASAQTVELVISEESEVDIASTVTVSGSVTVIEQPFPTFTTPADVSVPTASSSDIAANGARRAIVIGALASNAPATVNLRVRDQAATTAAGVELQPGTFVRIPTTAALRVRNNDANAQSYWFYEEL